MPLRVLAPTLVLSLVAAIRAFAQAGAVPPGNSAEMAPRGSVPSNIPAPPPSPAREVAQLKFFEGKWTCEGRVPIAVFSPVHNTKSTVVVTSDLDGFWYTGSLEEEKTAENANPMRGRFHWTYDAAQRAFRAMWFDNMGGWAAQTSSGWQGSKLAWMGTLEAGGKKLQWRDTFEKTPDGQMRHIAEAQLPSGWTNMAVEVCRKAVR
jgi:hypothetical protein